MLLGLLLACQRDVLDERACMGTYIEGGHATLSAYVDCLADADRSSEILACEVAVDADAARVERDWRVGVGDGCTADYAACFEEATDENDAQACTVDFEECTDWFDGDAWDACFRTWDGCAGRATGVGEVQRCLDQLRDCQLLSVGLDP
jgi:hypothetical protein